MIAKTVGQPGTSDLVEHLTYKQGIAGLNSALDIPLPPLVASMALRYL